MQINNGHIELITETDFTDGDLVVTARVRIGAAFRVPKVIYETMSVEEISDLNRELEIQLPKAILANPGRYVRHADQGTIELTAADLNIVYPEQVQKAAEAEASENDRLIDTPGTPGDLAPVVEG
jgi:hypothetical protein